MVKFNDAFKYSNIGTVVGTLCYAKPLTRKDGSQYGAEFLLNVKGHGSVNIRIPSMAKVEKIMDEFPVSDKPHIRVPMVQVESYYADSGKVYTNFTTFSEFKAVGDEVEDTAKGNISGEVIDITTEGKAKVVKLAVFQVDKDGNRITNYQGKELPEKFVKVEILEQELKQQLQQEVKVGTNLIVGYSYINKNDVSYDEYGLPVGSGNRITRIEAGKLVVNANPKTSDEPSAGVIDAMYDDPFTNGGEFEINDDDLPF